jgi:DNA-binding response OmpR family regulator
MVRILVVEDDPFVANLYRDVFELAGFHTDIAENGRTAISKLQRNAPDAVVLDLMLGDISGVEVRDHVRSQHAIWTTPVVVMSSSNPGPEMRAAWTNGADRCLDKKTNTPHDLLKEICSVLRSRREAALTAEGATIPGCDRVHVRKTKTATIPF